VWAKMASLRFLKAFPWYIFSFQAEPFVLIDWIDNNR
jgi:hypothetical protein